MNLKKTKSIISGLLIATLLSLGMESCGGSADDMQPASYTVSVTATKGGHATTDKETSIEGEQVTVTATAETGFSFRGWYEGESRIATTAEYSFAMPARNLALQAVFETQSQPSGNGKYLVVYYTWSNNTEAVANELHSIIGGDLIEVTPSTPYTTDYNTMLTVGQQELNTIDDSGTYPAINTAVESFNEYDIVFVGYPLWYSRMATPMQSFLHNHASKLSGKRIALFCTSASSSMSGTVADARRLCTDATFLESLRVGSSSVNNAHTSLVNWLSQIGVTTE